MHVSLSGLESRYKHPYFGVTKGSAYYIFTNKGQFTKALVGEIDLYTCHEFCHFLVLEILLLLRCQRMTQLGLNYRNFPNKKMAELTTGIKVYYTGQSLGSLTFTCKDVLSMKKCKAYKPCILRTIMDYNRIY